MIWIWIWVRVWFRRDASKSIVLYTDLEVERDASKSIVLYTDLEVEVDAEILALLSYLLFYFIRRAKGSSRSAWPVGVEAGVGFVIWI